MKDPLQSPHDLLFKHAFSAPRQAVPVLQKMLPAPLVQALDWSTLKREGTEWVDKHLTQRRNDIIYQIQTRDSGEPALLYVLFEHQSSVRKFMAWRMLGYVARLGEWYLQAHPEAKYLPLIIPTVVYHGMAEWHEPLTIRELYPPQVRDTEEFTGYAVNLRYALRDLQREPDSTLHLDGPLESLWGQVVLWILKRAAQGPLGPQLIEILQSIKRVVSDPAYRNAIDTVLRYHSGIDDGPMPMPTLRRIVDTFGKSTLEGHVAYIDQIRREGRQEGLQLGRQEGMQKGRQEGLQLGWEKGASEALRASIERVVVRRFGEVPQAFTDRLATMPLQQLSALLDRIVIADTLEEALADPDE